MPSNFLFNPTPFRVSLTINVRQALKAQDARQISMLITTVDGKTISSTAKELTGQEATELLEHLSKFVTADPRRLPVVVEWVRELVLAHAAFLSSQSSTKMRVKPLLDILNQRLADHSELVHMKQVTHAIIQNAQSTTSEITTPTNSLEEQQPMMRWTAQ
jgi:hypothetical protein